MTRKTSKKILVIDDDLAIRCCVQDALEFEGYLPLGAKNGREGLETARTEKPDLILLDMMMPEMTGHEFLGVWESDNEISGIPVIVFSVSKLEGKISAKVKKINKPVDLDVLFNEISDSLKKKKDPNVYETHPDC